MPTSALAPNPPAVRLRPVSPADEPLLRGLLDRVTGESRWTRFFTGGVDLDRVARMEARCDESRRFGVLALDPDGAVVGHGMCVPLNDGSGCEIAFEVADGHHRQGIGSAMLRQLVAEARHRGVGRLVAEVLPANRDMTDLLRDSALPLTHRVEGGVAHYEIALGGDDGEAPA
ncbi:GNAT family N-acetyltransferase [Patulibacter defluvii]|uniref:GNAT family N-acetyltransferase n=1 Tax=Patulibacter defluvii TaxID=3095358 RepID=UPI002A760DBA|nr:GNAT family N-acetyltransferase [Patulibacter sp. DM4]